MISNLPGDLESEILSRVPAKSLAKLYTTCKRWYAFFKDPKFVKKNLRKAAAKEVILLMTFGVYSISVDLHGIHSNADPSVEFTGKLTRLKDSKCLEISQIFHCDGLILASTKGTTSLVVWNPCTGETRSVRPRNRYLTFDRYALGYGNSRSSCRSYKILRLCGYYNDQEVFVAEIEMYEFGSDSWRVLDGFADKWAIISTAVSLKGKTYWIGLDREAGDVHVLLSFDFATERFVSLPLPYQSHDPEDTVVLSVVRGEQLAVLHQSTHTFSLVMKVWLTNKIDEVKEVSWSKFLVVDFDKFMLPIYTSVMSFLVDEENKVVVCCSKDLEGEDTIYIIGEDLHKQVYEGIAQGSRFFLPCLLSYLPSLARIPKARE